MSDEEQVLVSSSDHHTVTRYHRQLGETLFSVCSRLEPQNSPELINREDAEAEGLRACSLCRFPDERAEQIVADGGER